MSYLLLLPAVISFLVLAAHYMREVLGAGGPTLLNLFLFTMSLLAPLLFLWRDRRILRLVQLLLIMAALVWVSTAWEVYGHRITAHRPYRAAMVILGSVAAMNVLAAGLMELPALRRRYVPNPSPAGLEAEPATRK